MYKSRDTTSIRHTLTDIASSGTIIPLRDNGRSRCTLLSGKSLRRSVHNSQNVFPRSASLSFTNRQLSGQGRHEVLLFGHRLFCVEVANTPLQGLGSLARVNGTPGNVVIHYTTFPRIRQCSTSTRISFSFCATSAIPKSAKEPPSHPKRPSQVATALGENYLL